MSSVGDVHFPHRPLKDVHRSVNGTGYWTALARLNIGESVTNTRVTTCMDD